MKQLINENVVFTPGAAGAGTLDFSGMPNFKASGLVAVLNVSQGAYIYVPGVAGMGAVLLTPTLLQLAVSTAACTPYDELAITYDYGESAVGSTQPILPGTPPYLIAAPPASARKMRLFMSAGTSDAVTFAVGRYPALTNQNPLSLVNRNFDTATFAAGALAASNGGTSKGVGLLAALAQSVSTMEIKFETLVLPSAGNTAVIMGAVPGPWIGITPTGTLTCAVNGGNVELNGSVNVADGNAHHVALVMNGSLGATVYLDGVEAATTTTAVGTQTPTEFYVGNANFANSPALTFNGKTSEAAVWGYAKYTENFSVPTVPYVGNEAGLVALWPLGNSGGDIASPLYNASPLVLKNGAFDMTTAKFSGALPATNYGITSGARVLAAVNSASFTIEGFLKFNGSSPGTCVAFGASPNSGSDAGGWVGMDADGHATASYGPYGFEGSMLINDGNWHWVAMSVGPSGGILIVDGAVSSANTNAAIATSNSEFGVGPFGFNGSHAIDWPGEVAEVAVWNYARYPGAVTAPTAPYGPNLVGLVGLYHLDGNGIDSSDIIDGSPIVASAASTGPNWDVPIKNGLAVYGIGQTGNPRYQFVQ